LPGGDDQYADQGSRNMRKALKVAEHTLLDACEGAYLTMASSRWPLTEGIYTF